MADRELVKPWDAAHWIYLQENLTLLLLLLIVILRHKEITITSKSKRVLLMFWRAILPVLQRHDCHPNHQLAARERRV
jgi:hypothetical protein